MLGPFGNDLPWLVTLLGIAFGTIAFVGWVLFGWEYGAGFDEQPISFVLGVCGFVVAIGIALWRRIAD